MQTQYQLCKRCHHFVDVEPASSNDWVHLEDGNQEFDHAPEPTGYVNSLEGWKRERPDLFKVYPDGAVGPNSMYYNRRGKLDYELSGSDLQTFAVLDVCTRHITAEDGGKLSSLNHNRCSWPTIYDYGEGAFVHVPAEMSLDTRGWSKAFVEILKMAKRNNCRFVNFDSDGERYDNLPMFDW